MLRIASGVASGTASHGAFLLRARLHPPSLCELRRAGWRAWQGAALGSAFVLHSENFGETGARLICGPLVAGLCFPPSAQPHGGARANHPSTIIQSASRRLCLPRCATIVAYAMRVRTQVCVMTISFTWSQNSSNNASNISSYSSSSISNNRPSVISAISSTSSVPGVRTA